MTACSVIEAFDVGKDIAFGLLASCVLLVMDLLGFEGVEEAFHRCIVVAVGPTAHRGLDACGLQRGAVIGRCILNASVGMMDQVGARPSGQMAMFKAANGSSVRK